MLDVSRLGVSSVITILHRRHVGTFRNSRSSSLHHLLFLFRIPGIADLDVPLQIGHVRMLDLVLSQFVVKGICHAAAKGRASAAKAEEAEP